MRFKSTKILTHKLYKLLPLSVMCVSVLACKKLIYEEPALYEKLSGGWELRKIEIDGLDSSLYLNVDSLNMVSFLYFNPHGSLPQTSNNFNTRDKNIAINGHLNYIHIKTHDIKEWFYDYERFNKKYYKIYMIGCSINAQSDSLIDIREKQLYGINAKMKKIGAVNNFLFPWTIEFLNSEFLIISVNYKSKITKKYFQKRMI